MTNFDPSSYENEFVSVGKSVMKVLIFRWWFVDVCDNFAGGSQSDYNLELSLGSLSSKRSNLEQTDEEGSIGMDQRVPMAFESDWQRNTRPKVYIYIYTYYRFCIFSAKLFFTSTNDLSCCTYDLSCCTSITLFYHGY